MQPSKHLDFGLVRPWAEDLVIVLGLLPYRNYDIINRCCFKLRNAWHSVKQPQKPNTKSTHIRMKFQDSKCKGKFLNAFKENFKVLNIRMTSDFILTTWYSRKQWNNSSDVWRKMIWSQAMNKMREWNKDIFRHARTLKLHCPYGVVLKKS